MLNIIEGFWAKIKAISRRSRLALGETISSRVTEATKQIDFKDLNGWIKHSIDGFQACLSRVINLQLYSIELLINIFCYYFKQLFIMSLLIESSLFELYNRDF
jgi:hypothetical protein